jgi:hypothetical protein
MTHFRSLVARLMILAGCCVAWGAVPTDLRAQGVSSAAITMQNWRRASQGLSPNAALARYRMQSLGHPAQRSLSQRHPSGWHGTTLYSTPYYAVTTHRALPTRTTSYYPSTRYSTSFSPSSSTSSSTAGTPMIQKPFAEIRRPPNAIERYWPYMLEAREDPSTGVVIWRLP